MYPSKQDEQRRKRVIRNHGFLGKTPDESWCGGKSPAKKKRGSGEHPFEVDRWRRTMPKQMVANDDELLDVTAGLGLELYHGAIHPLEELIPRKAVKGETLYPVTLHKTRKELREEL